MSIELLPGGRDVYTFDQLVTTPGLFENVSITQAQEWHDFYLTGGAGSNNTAIALDNMINLFSSNIRVELPDDIAADTDAYREYFSRVSGKIPLPDYDLDYMREFLASDNLKLIKLLICEDLVPDELRPDVAHLFVWGAKILSECIPWIWRDDELRRRCAQNLLEGREWLKKLAENYYA